MGWQYKLSIYGGGKQFFWVESGLFCPNEFEGLWIDSTVKHLSEFIELWATLIRLTIHLDVTDWQNNLIEYWLWSQNISPWELYKVIHAYVCGWRVKATPSLLVWEGYGGAGRQIEREITYVNLCDGYINNTTHYNKGIKRVPCINKIMLDGKKWKRKGERRK